MDAAERNRILRQKQKEMEERAARRREGDPQVNKLRHRTTLESLRRLDEAILLGEPLPDDLVDPADPNDPRLQEQLPDPKPKPQELAEDAIDFPLN